MAKKKVIEVINTLPFDRVFSSTVKVDTEHRVLYDTETSLAIGYITPTYNRIEITIQPPECADIELRRVETDLMEYFDPDYICVSNHKLFYKVCGGHILIGDMSAYRVDLKLPRILIAGVEAETDDSDQD